MCVFQRTGDAKGHRGKTSGRSIFQSAPLRATSSALSRSISRAISKRLAIRHCTLFGRVGFSPQGKLLRFFTDEELPGVQDFHSSHSLEVIETAKHSVQESCRELQPTSLKRFLFRYNRRTFPPFFAPLAQLDRASGYEPEGREFESLRAHHLFSHLHGLPFRSLHQMCWFLFTPSPPVRAAGTCHRTIPHWSFDTKSGGDAFPRSGRAETENVASRTRAQVHSADKSEACARLQRRLLNRGECYALLVSSVCHGITELD